MINKSKYLLVTAILIGGCAVGPDFKAQQAPEVKSYSDELLELKLDMTLDQLRLVQSDTVPALWWQLFESKELEELVMLGLKESSTLASAKARLKVAEETFNASHSSTYFPTVDAKLNSSRQKTSGAAFGNTAFGNLYTVHNASVDISYNIDFFGSGSRYLESALAQVEFERFQLQAAQITLSTNIVTTAINEASLREQIVAMQEIIAAEAENLKVAEVQFEIGVMAKTALLSQRTALAQRRSQLPALQKALAQTRHQLATLLGKMPGEIKLPQFKFSALTQPRDIPLTLPSTLTRQRADVRAAEALLHQASAGVGMAEANLYPSINLSGSYGSEASSFSDLFSAGSTIWGLGAGVLQPIFRGGELRAKKRAAIAGYEQAAADYRSSVLIAFQDVADALSALEMDSKQLTLVQQTEKMASESLDLVNLQHDQGAVSLLTMLSAQQKYQEAKISLIQARAALYADTAALMYALGGGWWSQNDTQTNDAQTEHAQINHTPINQDDEMNLEKQL
ncbi:MAG: efflux transporter outer membrane subunit [Ghiorsea sp.]